VSFQDLYAFAQNQAVHVNRNAIKAECLRISDAEDIKFIRAGLDPSITRGYWLTPQNKDHHLVRQFGCHVVVSARGLNRCWERFVVVKEMMHLFDDEKQKTDDSEKFQSLLSEFASPMIVNSDQMVPEISSFWRALSVLCPERTRCDFQYQRKHKQIDDYEIALRLRIPAQYVPRLFEERYKKWLERNL